jgi:predicted nucleic acid-binding protein
MRVFLDANVLFSAAYRETGSVFFALADAGACELVSSAYAFDEARRNIVAATRAHWRPRSLLGRVTQYREPAPATLAWSATLQLLPKDAPILAAADAQCHLLVTGDRTHFGELFGRKLRGTIVLRPVDAIGLLAGD